MRRWHGRGQAAGSILAATFAAVGLVPLTAFQQIAFTMAIGLLIDTLIVRPVITPALLALLGGAARWPGRSVTEFDVDPVPSTRGRVPQASHRRDLDAVARRS